MKAAYGFFNLKLFFNVNSSVIGRAVRFMGQALIKKHLITRGVQ